MDIERLNYSGSRNQLTQLKLCNFQMPCLFFSNLIKHVPCSFIIDFPLYSGISGWPLPKCNHCNDTRRIPRRQLNVIQFYLDNNSREKETFTSRLQFFKVTFWFNKWRRALNIELQIAIESPKTVIITFTRTFWLIQANLISASSSSSSLLLLGSFRNWDPFQTKVVYRITDSFNIVPKLVSIDPW